MNDFIEREVSEVREDLQRIKDFFQKQDFHERALRMTLVEYRHMPESAIKDSDAFFVPDKDEFPIVNYPKWMYADDLKFMNRNKECRFAGRLVFPVKSVKAEVIGFVGWSAFESPKYLDSANVGYKAGSSTFFGMENLPEYYVSNRPIFIPEGLMCTLYLRANSFQSMSSLGSNLSKYQVEILKRFKDRCVVVIDNDAAGKDWAQRVKWQLPKASIVCVTHGKDIDGCRKENENVYEDILLSDLHKFESGNPFQRYSEIIKIR